MKSDPIQSNLSIIKLRLSNDLRSSGKAYTRFNIHSEKSDSVHFMIMALKPLTSAIWHRSIYSGPIFYSVIEGELMISELSSTSHKYISHHSVTPDCLPVRLNRDNWRTVSNTSGEISFYYEVCPGPHVPNDTLWNLKD